MLLRVGRRRPAAHRHLYHPDDFLWPYQLNPKPLCIAEFQSDKDFSLLSPFPLRVAVLNLDTWTISGLYVWLLLLTTHKDIWGTEKRSWPGSVFTALRKLARGGGAHWRRKGKGERKRQTSCSLAPGVLCLENIWWPLAMGRQSWEACAPSVIILPGKALANFIPEDSAFGVCPGDKWARSSYPSCFIAWLS